MSSQPRAFFTLDLGAATAAAALVGHIGGRWRLLAAAAGPAAVGPEPLLDLLAGRLRAADPEALAEIAPRSSAGSASDPADWPRLVARSTPPAALAALAASRRQRLLLERAARRAGWRVLGASLDESDGLALSRLALSADVSAILVGSDEPPGGDERDGLPELIALAGAASRRRPDLRVVLAGGATLHAASFRASTPAGPPSGAEPAAPGGSALERIAGEGNGREVLLAAGAGAAGGSGRSEGEELRELLAAVRSRPDDARRGIARATEALAHLFDRTVETVEIGLDGGLRSRAAPAGEAHGRVAARRVESAVAALVPADPDESVVDGILAWSTVPLDRYRLGDRLLELRLAPWSEADGEGALLRVAAARAALERLVAQSPEIEALPPPDLTIAAGGVWAVAPPPVVALVVADHVRRAGTTQLALDHARLLGPLGTIEDDGELRAVLTDLAQDLLAPLGSLILPAGLRAGRSAGRLVVHAEAGATELDLVPGGLELVDLPPGQAATAELDFRDAVRLGTRGRRFATRVSGGLGGLLVDLRDVPLRLPERPERRRELLDAWQSALWTGLRR